MAIFRQLGGALTAAVGSKLKLPEFGLSERVSGYRPPPTPQPAKKTSAPQSISQYPIPMSSYRPTGSVLGAQSPQRSSGGGGGGTPQPAAPQQSLLESYPDAPSFDETPFNDIIGQIDALGGVFTNNVNQAVGQLQQRETSQLGELEQEKALAEKGLNTFEDQNTATAESAKDEARRQYSEIQQGLQARYGGTTGTGAFVTEQAGSQTLRNIGQINQTLSQERAKARDLFAQLQLGYVKEKSNIQNTVSGLIQEARAQLDQQLAELNMQKGQVQAQKAQRKTEALQEYQRSVMEINARNTDYLRQLDDRRDQATNTLKSKAYQLEYNANKYQTQSVQELYKAGALNNNLDYVESVLGYPSGSLSPIIPVRSKTLKEKDEDENVDDEAIDSLSNLDYSN